MLAHWLWCTNTPTNAYYIHAFPQCVSTDFRTSKNIVLWSCWNIAHRAPLGPCKRHSRRTMQIYIYIVSLKMFLGVDLSRLVCGCVCILVGSNNLHTNIHELCFAPSLLRYAFAWLAIPIVSSRTFQRKTRPICIRPKYPWCGDSTAARSPPRRPRIIYCRKLWPSSADAFAESVES